MQEHIACIYRSILFIFCLVLVGCEDLENSRMKYYVYKVGTGQDQIVSEDFTLRTNMSEIIRNDVLCYFQVYYRDDGRISYSNFYSKPIIDDSSIMEENNQESESTYKWQSSVRYSYDKNGRLSETDSGAMITKFQYIDNWTASYVTTDKKYGIGEIRGIVKFNEKSELIYEETVYSNGEKVITVIEYLDNKKIVQNTNDGFTEKHEIEYKNGEIVRIEYSNNRGESRILGEKDWKFPPPASGR